MSERRFAIRTVRKGRVKIGGRIFRPRENHLAYDGRLDGLRMTFGCYLNSDGNREPFVQLWGTEARFKRLPEGEGDGPEVVDGTLPWMWWDEESGQ